MDEYDSAVDQAVAEAWVRTSCCDAPTPAPAGRELPRRLTLDFLYTLAVRALQVLSHTQASIWQAAARRLRGWVPSGDLGASNYRCHRHSSWLDLPGMSWSWAGWEEGCLLIAGSRRLTRAGLRQPSRHSR